MVAVNVAMLPAQIVEEEAVKPVIAGVWAWLSK